LTLPAIGILGGTFDPIHLGHLRLAEEVADALRLAQVRFIPCGTPPHRSAPRSSAEHRVAMIRLAIANNPRFALDERELQRAGPSYTFETISAVRTEVGAAVPLVLIMGADAFIKFDTWHRWREIFDLAHIAVAHRPGSRLTDMSALITAQYQQRRMNALDGADTAAGHLFEVPITALDISATRIRATIAGHRSARYLLPAEVYSYIECNALFSKEI
jgi:nicotinate-nucleotide adenylyltransferase